MKKLLKYLTSASLLLLINGCTSSTLAPVSDINAEGGGSAHHQSQSKGSYRGSFYKVNKGDTLYFIAYVTDKDVNDLIKYNYLQPPYTIQPGQKINLWSSTYVPPSYGVTKYTAPVLIDSETRPGVTELNTQVNADDGDNVQAGMFGNEPQSAIMEENVNTPSQMASERDLSIESDVATTGGSNQISSTGHNGGVIAIAAPVSNSRSEPKAVAESTASKGDTAAKTANITNKNIKNSVSSQSPDSLANKHDVASKVEASSVESSQTKGYRQNRSNDNVNAKLDNSEITSWLWPTQGRLISKFSTGDQGNKGIDIAGQRGQSVLSTAAGTVVYSGDALRGYGNLVIVKHNDNYLSAYAHNDQLLVKEGQTVAAGQKIASMGSSGTNSVRLHFEIRYQGKSVNPQRYLPAQ
jgi:lipoprotein NlpD